MTTNYSDFYMLIVFVLFFTMTMVFSKIFINKPTAQAGRAGMCMAGGRPC